MCLIAVAGAERRESAYGYKRLFSGVPADFRCQPESRPSCHNVRFSFDCFCFTPESGPGAEGPFWSAVDPYRKFTIPAAAAYFNSSSSAFVSSRHPRAVCPRHLAAGCHRAKLPASLEWTGETVDISDLIRDVRI